MITSLSIVIPVYNSAAALPLLLDQLREVLPAVTAESEIILVNDGSTDASWKVITEAAAQDGRIIGIDLMRNYGQHNALLCGVRAARSEFILTMDDDLQHPPAEIHRLVEAMDEHWDVVYGSPERERHGLWRNLASWMTKAVLQRTMGIETARRVSAFRLFRTGLRDAFERFRGPFVSLDVLLTWGSGRFRAVTVRTDRRHAGASNYSFRKLVVHAFNMLTGFSTLPLQLAGLVGFSFALFGLAVLAFVLGRFIVTGGSVPGFPFLASIIAIFAGAQLFAIGIMGEYLARMHFHVMDKPAYTVASRTGEGDDGK